MNHKLAAINFLFLALIGFSILALAVGYFQIKKIIYSPFATPKSSKQTADVQKLLAEAQKQDTDKDGLPDFEELYKYRTSANIADSDSDNFSDKEEIEAGSNPLNALSTPQNKQVLEPNLEEQVFSLIKQGVSEGQNQAEPSIGNEPTSQEIRDFLVKKGGLAQEIVDKIDDKALLELYNETKTETGLSFEALGQAEAQNESEQTQPFLENLEALTPAEIRQLLIANGADAQTLEQVDDQTLKMLFLEAVK